MILRQWSQAAARPVSVAQLGRALEGVAAERIGACLDASGGTPVDRAAAVIEAVLTALPRAETVALILADAALSRAVGQGHLLPLLALAVKPRDLRLRGEALRWRATGCGVGCRTSSPDGRGSGKTGGAVAGRCAEAAGQGIWPGGRDVPCP